MSLRWRIALAVAAVASLTTLAVGIASYRSTHARLYRDAKGRWHVANNKSANGVWVRAEQMPLTGSCQFQVGEQRFLFRVH